MSEHKTSGIQVIARAAAVMRTLGDNPKGLSLAAIANIVGLPRSTVQRIITALEEEYLVESLRPQGGFRLGPALGMLANQTQSDIISMSRPFLSELSQLVEESVTLASLVGDKIYVIDRVISERELRIVFPLGIHPPSYATSSGKVLLAELSPASVSKLLPENWPALTPNTLDRPALLAQLEEIRQCGVAHDREEYLEGVCSTSTVIHTYLGNFSIAIVAPSSRANPRIDRFQSALRDTKQAMERMIGSHSFTSPSKD